MPTYEYECRSCGADFDVFQSMSEDPLKVCPTCGNSVRRKIQGGTGIIFKGSGFYKNDSRKVSASDSAKAEQGGSDISKSASPAKAESQSASSSTASGSAKKETT